MITSIKQKVERMLKLIKGESISGLIEYKGDFYTQEELTEKLKLEGNFEIIENNKETWFDKALTKDLEQ